MAKVTGKLLPLHDLQNVNTVLGMLYDADGVYRPEFEPEVFYNTILLDTLKYGEENFVHLKYAENLSIKKGETVAKFRRWAGLTPTLRPLKEGVPPAPDKHASETIEVGNVFSFGRWSEYTDQIDLSIISEVVSERSLQYGEIANQTKELYARKTWLASPNEFFAEFKDFASLAFGDEVLLDDLRFLIARMKRMLVKSIAGKFNYICSTEFINGLIDDPRVIQYMKLEQTTGKLWSSGEPFPMFDLNFIPTMLDEFAYPDTEHAGVYEKSDGLEVVRLYAITEGTVYYMDVHQDFVTKGTDTAKKLSGKDYLPDGTAVENHYEWVFAADATPLVSGTVQDGTSNEATEAKVALSKSTITRAYNSEGIRTTSYSTPEDATGDLVAINALIANGAFMELPVHRGILFGMEALVKLSVDGLSDAPRIIIKPLGSSGVGDPLEQRQSLGFRVDGFGLAIKRPEAICITYGIPKNAELAALTDQYITGEYTLLDSLNGDSASGDANRVNEDGEGILRVDAVNSDKIVPLSPYIRGAGEYPVFATGTDYVIGNKVLYNGKPYVFIADHGAGAWNGEHATQVKVSLELNVLPGNDPKSNIK